MQDRTAELIQPALERAQGFSAKRLKDPKAAAEAVGRLRADVGGEGAALADVVIEAIFENVDAKRALYAELEPRIKPDAVLATNTSSIKIEVLAEKLKDPSRLVGIHFFNPVAQMQLVEIVHGAGRPNSLRASGLCGSRASSISCRFPAGASPDSSSTGSSCPISTRRCLRSSEGIPAAVIDRAGTRFGMPVGPIELADVVGLDVALHVGRVLAEAFNRPVPEILIERVQQKKLGRKSGEGFYVWRDGKAVPPSGPPPRHPRISRIA